MWSERKRIPLAARRHSPFDKGDGETPHPSLRDTFSSRRRLNSLRHGDAVPPPSRGRRVRKRLINKSREALASLLFAFAGV